MRLPPRRRRRPPRRPPPRRRERTNPLHISEFFQQSDGCKKPCRNCPLNAFQRLLFFAFGLGTVTGRANGTPITQDEREIESIFFTGKRSDLVVRARGSKIAGARVH